MNKRNQPPKPLTVKPRYTLAQTMSHFSTEDACKAYLRDLRWPSGVRCPRCQNENVHAVKAEQWRWQCRKCNKNGYRFSVITGTIFENTKYPLVTWFQVGYLMCQSKKGMSALQIHRQIGSGSYETAWYMCTRIRAAMKNETFDQLIGEVEADETWIGGKNKNQHANKRMYGKGEGGQYKDKTMVIGAISRKGNVVCQMIEEAGFNTLQNFVKEAVSQKVTLISTDENSGYRQLTRAGYPHQTVNHSKQEYVVGAIHTNTIERFWSLLKRGIVGSYHKVSKNYLPLYLNEFAFRYNHRENPDIFRALLSRV
ncbi:MAG: IS1595 family transposase [Candidatus Binatus sp.]|uniref:IS1595 family transposase n=1 Tax=Candidatus Binatus sp. TaxID=2811406 RepID=UPI0027273F9C|nr:IS1595 family transposase [Candidatus Binatus sp.]MDO8432285.1 IS1595 family transposase [Candidatus Binatus sp.]